MKAAKSPAESWTNELSRRPQNYLTVPNQPWLDGFCVGKGMIRQFVAMPLGQGYTAEEQLTGTAEHGGLQIIAYPMQAVRYEAWAKKQAARDARTDGYAMSLASPSEMGLAPGGLMRQKIYRDKYGFENVGPVGAFPLLRALFSTASSTSRCRAPRHPACRLPAKDYTDAGLPWFDYYGGDLTALDGAQKLTGLDSVAAKKLKQGEGVLADNDPVQPAVVKTLHGDRVREGEF